MAFVPIYWVRGLVIVLPANNQADATVGKLVTITSPVAFTDKVFVVAAKGVAVPRPLSLKPEVALATAAFTSSLLPTAVTLVPIPILPPASIRSAQDYW